MICTMLFELLKQFHINFKNLFSNVISIGKQLDIMGSKEQCVTLTIAKPCASHFAKQHKIPQLYQIRSPKVGNHKRQDNKHLLTIIPQLYFIKVIEKCTNFYFGTEKLPPKF